MPSGRQTCLAPRWPSSHPGPGAVPARPAAAGISHKRAPNHSHCKIDASRFKTAPPAPVGGVEIGASRLRVSPPLPTLAASEALKIFVQENQAEHSELRDYKDAVETLNRLIEKMAFSARSRQTTIPEHFPPASRDPVDA